MIRKSIHKDTVNPPGQIVNPVPNFEKPMEKHIQEFLDTEEQFAPCPCGASRGKYAPGCGVCVPK